MTGECVIYKYQFQIADEFSIEMPFEAIILHVDVQGGVPCIWAMVDPDAEKVQRKFRIIGTGRRHESTLAFKPHIATFQMPPYVWHLFEDE